LIPRPLPALLDKDESDWPMPAPRLEAHLLTVGAARSAADDDKDDDCVLCRIEADAAADATLPRPTSGREIFAATAGLCGVREAGGAACAVILLEDWFVRLPRWPRLRRELALTCRGWTGAAVKADAEDDAAAGDDDADADEEAEEEEAGAAEHELSCVFESAGIRGEGEWWKIIKTDEM
jgi:hypothetical protein